MSSGSTVPSTGTVRNLPAYRKAFLVKSCFLETVVYIGRQDELIFILYKFKQLFIYRFRGVCITVDPDITAPVRPVFYAALDCDKIRRNTYPESRIFL